ncbi:hypothetical protein HAX54_015227 [Datura stramonium]|uniref:Uncharacterized protein n=1 Tax=Datura stramonium TaxID=4076 RepID=A0ABS8TPH4_DATST|nr:hypothetical protein [Datura stramonium]
MFNNHEQQPQSLKNICKNTLSAAHDPSIKKNQFVPDKSPPLITPKIQLKIAKESKHCPSQRRRLVRKGSCDSQKIGAAAGAFVGDLGPPLILPHYLHRKAQPNGDG